MAKRSESRIATTHIPVRCTPEQKIILKARAAAFGVSCAELVRSIIFGAKPKSKVDKEAIAELAATRADLGRLGGLFKGWLAGSFEVHGTPGPKTKTEIVRLIREIEATQKKVIDTLKSIESRP